MGSAYFKAAGRGFESYRGRLAGRLVVVDGVATVHRLSRLDDIYVATSSRPTLGGRDLDHLRRDASPVGVMMVRPARVASETVDTNGGARVSLTVTNTGERAGTVTGHTRRISGAERAFISPATVGP